MLPHSRVSRPESRHEVLILAPGLTRPSRCCRDGRVKMDHDGHDTKQPTPFVRKVPATDRGAHTPVRAEPVRSEDPRKL